jgi:regulator of protease activity HflC (stomatin/prohibitin superfamily)
VNLAPFSLEVVESNVVAKDGVPLTVGGRMVAQVVDPVRAATRVVDYVDATRKMLQTAIRAAVRDRPSPELSRDTAALGTDVIERLTDALGKWGLVVSSASVDLGVAGKAE